MNQFLEACGATGPLLLNVEAPGVAAEVRSYDLPFALIGKDARCDLRLDHPEVSPRHAYIQLVNGRLLCADLGSRSGVHQGGKRRRLGWLDRDRAVRIGPYRIRLLSGDNHVPRDGSEADYVDGAAEARGLRKPVFELSHRSVRLSRCEVAGGLALVGSAADCEVRLIDPSVTSYHCALVSTAEGVWVVDLLGQGGIRVNGHEVSYARLVEGDTLQLGHSLIRHLAAPDEAVSDLQRHEAASASVAPALPPLHTTAFVAEPATASFQTNRIAVDDSDEAEPYHSSEFWLNPQHGSEDGFVFGHSASQPANGTAKQAHTELALPMSQAVELVERVLAPMLGQVGVMQRQMVDELHQSRVTMFEMFTALQQEQTSALDHELDQIRQISLELSLFRSDLERQSRELSDLTAKLAAAETTTAAPVVPATQSAASHVEPSEAGLTSSVTLTAPAPPSRPVAPTTTAPAPQTVQVPIALPDQSSRIFPTKDHDDKLTEIAAVSSVRIDAPTPVPVPVSIPAAAAASGTVQGDTADKGRVARPSVVTAVPIRSERKGPIIIPSLPVPQVMTRTSEAMGPILLQAGPSVRTHDETIHNQLCDRIVKFRDEHQSRWKRLLSKIPGGGSNRTSP